MKTSRESAAATRRRIVDVASHLFLERGLAETNIADVMIAAGLTQGGFYRHFESKEQLIAEANRAANEQLFAYYNAAVVGMSPMQAIDTIAHLYLKQSQQADVDVLCPLANLGAELRHTNQHIRTAAMEGYRNMLDSFSKLAGQLGIIDHIGVANTIVSTIVGAVTLSRLAVDVVTARTTLKSARTMVRKLVQAASMAQRLDASIVL